MADLRRRLGLEGTWDDDTRAVTYESQIEEDPLPAEKAVAGTRLDDVLAPDEYGTTFGGRARIRALGDNDTASEWSDWADYQCLPTGFTAECLAPAHSAVTVWWDAYAGGGTLLRYEAEEDGGDLAAFSGTATSFARRSPTGDAYRWRARMVFDDGNGGETEGPWTPWADLECPPAQPTGLVLACADKTITLWGSYFGAVFPIGSAAGWEVSGTWNADTRAVTYEHQRLTDPLAAPAALTGTVLGTARTSTDFSAGSYRIRALGNNNIVSEWSEWADYECLPIPTGLTVDCSSGTTVAVSWDPNPSATGYEAEEDGSSLPAYSGAAASFTRTATTGDTYRWRVRATIGGIETQWSDWAEATCGQPPANLRVACTSGGTVPAILSASWDPVAWASGYEAEEDGGDMATYAGTAVSFTRPHPLAAVNTEYRWRVRATGTGSLASAWSGWMSDTCPPAAPTLTIACGPAPLSRTLTVDWTAPAGARDYQVEASTTSAAFTAYYGTATSASRLGTWGATYELRVRAWSAAGGWSNWTAYDTATCPPSPVPSTGPVVTGGDPDQGNPNNGGELGGNGCWYGLIKPGWPGGGGGWLNPPPPPPPPPPRAPRAEGDDRLDMELGPRRRRRPRAANPFRRARGQPGRQRLADHRRPRQQNRHGLDVAGELVRPPAHKPERAAGRPHRHPGPRRQHQRQRPLVRPVRGALPPRRRLTPVGGAHRTPARAGPVARVAYWHPWGVRSAVLASGFPTAKFRLRRASSKRERSATMGQPAGPVVGRWRCRRSSAF